jgi:hypothetical protein
MPLGPFRSGAENGPWMSSNHSELWFTDFSARHQLFHVLDPLGTPSAPTLLTLDDGTSNYDDAFVDNAGALWFTFATAGTSVICEAPKNGTNFQPPMCHSELAIATAQEPSVSRNGLTLYFSDGTDLYVATRTLIQGPFNMPIQMAFHHAESPSVTNDGMELYFKDLTFSTPKLGYATISGDALTDHGQVLPFQDPTQQYLDPDITADGNTLVFAIGKASAASLAYVIRTCTP